MAQPPIHVAPWPAAPRPRYRRAGAIAPFALLWVGAVAGCTDAAIDHPWIRLGPDSPHVILEVSGSTGAQAAILMPPAVTREEALELGRLIHSQAPPGATVNVRLFNDEATARNWRSAPAEMTLRHLLVVVQIVPETGLSEVRWVGPQ